ncbi:hypothetical protein TNCV_716351 [Trichonephila clavipes]|nr:hypothetical protein TNCV_716351 [Trichonephila clavipes]
MAYLGKGLREDLFVLATELNLKFDKSMTIATLKDLIIGSENYDEELTKNIHSTIVEDRKAREENLRIEEREERLRFEQLRLDEQKRKDEFELEKFRIQTQSKLGADTSKESDTKFLVKEVSKFIHRFDLKEDISLYLKLFERQAQRLNIDQENRVSHLSGLLPTEVSHVIAREPDDEANSYKHAEKLEEFEDFKRSLKQKSSIPFVKKQEFKFTEKNRRYEAPGKFEYNRKDKKFPASTNYNKHYEALVTKYESVQRYQDSAQKKGITTKLTRNTQITMLPSIYDQTNYSKSQKFKEPPKETCTLIVKEGVLNPISKESIPLSTYHVDFIGPLPSTNKSYQHIFTVVDAFTKFTWLYPVKTVSAESALEKLKQQQKTFGNPIRIMSDRGSAFTSKLFNDYCDKENIQQLQIATGVPRGNGQVERIHRTLIPVLTKLSLDDSTKWYKYVDRLQRILNSTICCSTKWTSFKLLVRTKMRNKEGILIKDLLLEEMVKELLEQREFLRNDAKKNIETLQSENRKTYNRRRKKASLYKEGDLVAIQNRKTYNRRRKKASLYKEGDLVAIQRTQFGAGLKLRPKFLGPYKETKVNPKDRYKVEKVGQHEGPNSTTTSEDFMKHFYA